MNKIVTLLFLILILSACGNKPKIDASSVVSFQQSFDAMKASLTPEKQTEFLAAWEALMSERLGTLFVTALLGSADSKPEEALTEAFKEFHGKTADGIIAMGETIVEQQRDAKRVEATTRIPELEKELAEAEAELATAQTELAQKQVLLDAYPQIGVSFSNVRVESGYLGARVLIDFSINNYSPFPLESVGGHFVVYSDESKTVMLQEFLSMSAIGSDVDLNSLASGASVTVKDMTLDAYRLDPNVAPYLEFVFNDFRMQGQSYNLTKAYFDRTKSNVEWLEQRIETLRDELNNYQAAIE